MVRDCKEDPTVLALVALFSGLLAPFYTCGKSTGPTSFFVLSIYKKSSLKLISMSKHYYLIFK
jgi:hypothetical protein